jgi:hypothetical protein
MIDPNIWQSEDFSRLSTLGKLVFIGLFSLADDEGKGRCNPVYLKSTLFPYEEGIRSADIDKTLSEISSNMSVILYSCDGSSYYSLYNWNTWQKIDKPSASKIPDYDKNVMARLFVDNSENDSRKLVESSTPNKNKKENKNMNKKENTFTPPTLEDIKKYVVEKNLNVDGEQFYNYFTEGNWVDSKGNKVKNWKQKLLTWSGFSKADTTQKKTTTNHTQRDYKDIDFNKFCAN